jgi:multiple sugar transport system permease protein
MTAFTMTSAKRRKVVRLVVIYTLVTLLAVVLLFPFYWMFASSVKPEEELYRSKPTLFPETFTTFHYERLFRHTNFSRYFLNSTVIALVSATGAMIIAAPAAYSLGRLRYRGRNAAAQLTVILRLFPGVILMLPLYVLVARMKLTDNLLALVLIYISFQIPYAAMLLRAYFLAIPTELEDAARVDGASRMRVLVSIILPLARPGLTAAWIRSFILSWSEFIMASILMNSEKNKTVAVGLYEWMGTYHIDWGAMSAGGVLVTIPIFFFFLIAGKTLVKGLLGGAVKG